MWGIHRWKTDHPHPLVAFSWWVCRGRWALRMCYIWVRGKDSWDDWRRWDLTPDLEGRRCHYPPEKLVQKQFAVSSVVWWVHDRGKGSLAQREDLGWVSGCGWRCSSVCSCGCSVPAGPFCQCLSHPVPQQSCLVHVTSHYSEVNF